LLYDQIFNRKFCTFGHLFSRARKPQNQALLATSTINIPNPNGAFGVILIVQRKRERERERERDKQTDQ